MALFGNEDFEWWLKAENAVTLKSMQNIVDKIIPLLVKVELHTTDIKNYVDFWKKTPKDTSAYGDTSAIMNAVQSDFNDLNKILIQINSFVLQLENLEKEKGLKYPWYPLRKKNNV